MLKYQILSKFLQLEQGCITRTDGLTADATTLIIVFRNFATAPKNIQNAILFSQTRLCACIMKVKAV